MGASSSIHGLEAEAWDEIVKAYGVEVEVAKAANEDLDAGDTDAAGQDESDEPEDAPAQRTPFDTLKAFAEAHDPWLELTDAALCDIEAAIDELEEEEMDTNDELATILAQENESKAARNIRVLDSACDLLEVAAAPAPGRHQLVALDLTENACASIARPMRLGLPWLRKLSLGSASLATETLDLRGLWRLAVLDISYIQTRDNASIDFSPLNGTLQRLVADGCGWQALPASVSLLHGLKAFSAQENELADGIALVAALSPLHALRELDLRENPFQEHAASQKEYQHLAHERLPGLCLLDNHLLKTDGANVALKAVPHLREDMNRTDTVADANEDREGCSCIEGTPCEIEYTCKDWKHRNEIAAYVREHGVPPASSSQ